MLRCFTWACLSGVWVVHAWHMLTKHEGEGQQGGGEGGEALHDVDAKDEEVEGQEDEVDDDAYGPLQAAHNGISVL